MREDDQVWWTIGSWRTSGRIDMVRADTIVDACLALRAEPCRVHECSTPYLLKLAADRPSEEPWAQPVESTPSVYDQFKRPGFSGWDYQAMRDAGFDLD
jgi:beta-glucanase (GH16 family)